MYCLFYGNVIVVVFIYFVWLQIKIVWFDLEGDLVIGVLFLVYKGLKDLIGYICICGEVWEQYGIYWVEIFFCILEEINNDSFFLFNIILGYDI